MAQNRFHLIQKSLLLCGACLLTGCATPEYLMPSGYSSTYQKALLRETAYIQQTAPLNPAVLQHVSADTATPR